MDKINLVLSILLLVVGILSIPRTYKNRKILNIIEMYRDKDNHKYEVANEKQFLKLQNIKGILMVIIIISIGALSIMVSYKFLILCIISPISDFIFSRLSKEHLKLKE
ncbi:MAG: hypothetical protein N2B06_18700 [Clostridium sp.]